MDHNFLIIDMKMNTLLIDIHDQDLEDYMKYKRLCGQLSNQIKEHRTLKELDRDIRKYLKTGYLEGGVQDD